MRAHWISAAVLSTLVAGCGGAPQNIEEIEEPVPATAPEDQAEAPPAVSPGGDTPGPASRPAARPSSPSSRPAGSEQAGRQEPSLRAEPGAEYRDLQVAAGTALPLELLTDLSSETATVEMPVRARLNQGISVAGVTVLPAGTELRGTVTEVAQAGRVKGRARLSFAFTEAVVNGSRERLQTNPITFEAQGTTGEDAAKIGVGAGIGAAIGGILGGGSGAAKGAAIGGGIGTGAVLATKGLEVTVASGTDLAATLAEPYTTQVRVQ